MAVDGFDSKAADPTLAKKVVLHSDKLIGSILLTVNAYNPNAAEQLREHLAALESRSKELAGDVVKLVDEIEKKTPKGKMIKRWVDNARKSAIKFLETRRA